MWLYLFILMETWLLAVGDGEKNVTSSCGREEKFIFYMDLALEMMTKAKENRLACNSRDPPSTKAIDCEDLQKLGHKKSGIYTIWPNSRILDGSGIDVFCDMDTDGGGWTVIQRRGDFKFPKDYFFREWSSYKTGFGELDKEFWLGNDNIFALTSQRLYSIRFDLKDMTSNTTYALYDKFWIDDEAHLYTLHIQEYSGTAGDSMIPVHNNMAFSTKDKDNDSHQNSCAQMFKGAWWYNQCHNSNLNALNHFGKHSSHADGINWKSWKGHNESLMSTEIKIRSKKFKKISSITNRDGAIMTPE